MNNLPHIPKLINLVTRLCASLCRVMRWLAILPIRLYQLFLSPALPPSCRFYPSCSAYMIEAIQIHGLVRGGWLGLCRLGRCHPWAEGGVDPVPPVRLAPQGTSDVTSFPQHQEHPHRYGR